MAGTLGFRSVVFKTAVGIGSLAWSATGFTLPDRCPIFFDSPGQCDPIAPASFLPASMNSATITRRDHIAENSVFADLLSALNVTQSEYFAPWLGTWPDAIDWTAAVIGTHVSAVARSVSEDLVFLNSKEDTVTDWRRASNLIDSYFAQIIGFYFGQDAVAMRYEAYDDILWVVLGWLETTKFINTHSDLNYAFTAPDLSEETPGVTDGRFNSCAKIPNGPYHGSVWVPAFSHRARIFWDLASHGWDTKLCNGGMLWNPRLLPYKNAITNELYIAASISMYLNFPGDDNESPYSNRTDRFNPGDPDSPIPSGPRDPKYLKAAVEGYKWLRNSNMTNAKGLIVDGFHISGYLDEHSNNTKCDQRDEMVYSYNQGVLLTGQRGLFDATGASSFLSDGHRLIQKVIKATGWDLILDKPIDDPLATKSGILPRWHGLGRLGVMEEYVDASGTGSQDLQTFKGIFFHHLAAFCAPLEAPDPELTGQQVHDRAFAGVRDAHADACKAYSGWLAHNVHAAMGTRDSAGRFGQWWTAGLLAGDWVGPWPTLENDGIDDDGRGEMDNATDYRNTGVPSNTMWRGPAEPTSSSSAPYRKFPQQGQSPLAKHVAKPQRQAIVEDPNDRGRGRTVETQSGGLGLLRAYWKIARTL
ncbi:glycosyl hydrolase family 76-domain-containing protein [Nemania sp. FL0916]|nr:glycosyl hydrolase family 76-domain-containing protein [Nemania sp. FL0916]